MPSIDSIIDRELRRWEFERTRARHTPASRPPTAACGELITVSRQHGSAGSAIAERLAQRLHYTLLHRDVIDRMCESTDARRRLLAALDEHTRSQLSIWVDSMLAGRYVDEADYLSALMRVIFSISELGGVVVVGRGANFIVGPQRGFHVRVVAPRPARLRTLMERDGITPNEAVRALVEQDRERARFVRNMFGRSIEDPLAYDVVVNSDGAPAEEISEWLAHAAQAKIERSRLASGTPARMAAATG
jgi:cytidylate kinase